MKDNKKDANQTSSDEKYYIWGKKENILDGINNELHITQISELEDIALENIKNKSEKKLREHQ